MPGADGDPLGIITRTSSLGSRVSRVCVFWMKENEQSWEPRKWLVVINESR